VPVEDVDNPVDGLLLELVRAAGAVLTSGKMYPCSGWSKDTHSELAEAIQEGLEASKRPEPGTVAGRCPGVQISSIVRWLLNKPGSTDLAPLAKLVPQAGGHEQRLRELTDDELTAAAQAARDDAETCACGREAARRALGERPYDVQVLGALAMLSGLVAEMGTGEGKTLSGALAAAGYAQRGRPVHVMSVNDYLARRDAEWMRPVYDLLGVTVGWFGQGSTAAERRRAYAAQVTYAPVSEFGFDVLRDRLVTDVADLVAGDPDVALIDEADSVLIDEARVPLVLAGAAETASTCTRPSTLRR
jgi:preprotein translocase subunit SecA